MEAHPNLSASQGPRRHPAGAEHFLGLDDLLIGIMVCLPMAALYLVGCQRAVGQGDMAEFTVASYTLGIPHPPGYPIYTWLGKAFSSIPLGGLAFRVNAMSSVFAAMALLLAFLIVVGEARRVLGAGRLAYLYGGLSVILLGFARPFWHYAEVAEVYTLNAFLILLFLTLFMMWQSSGRLRLLVGASLVLGLSLGTHLSNMLIVPVLLMLVWTATRNPRTVGRSMLFVLIGAAQYLYLILRVRQAPPYLHPHAQFFDGARLTGSANAIYNWLWFITGARWRGHYVGSSADALRKLREFQSTITENYAAGALIILLAGTWLYVRRCRERRSAAILISLLIIQAAYFIIYEWSAPGMILPLFAVCSILIALGTCAMSRALSGMIGDATRAVPLGSAVAAVFAAAVFIWLSVSSASRPPVDLSHMGLPSVWIEKTITTLPKGSTLAGLGWDYEKIVDYYRLVERRDIPFDAADCSAEAIKDGRCFVLAVPQAMARYRKEGYRLIPTVYVEEMPVAFQVSAGDSIR
jgi:hypothetical protein